MKYYTITELAELAGITSRTLRHYDEIGILVPIRRTEAGYREYSQAEVDRLQQILLYKTCGLELEKIKEIVMNPNFEPAVSLREQIKILKKQQKEIDEVIQTIKKTIAKMKGKITMTDDQKFAGLKQKMLEDNASKYGEEVQQRWGKETWEEEQKRFSKLTSKEFEQSKRLEREFKSSIRSAYSLGDPSNEEAQKAIDLHRQWLQFYWSTYSLEAHLGLAEMYIADERFHHYFDDDLNLAKFFLQALQRTR